jgi:hypothetical protein
MSSTYGLICLNHNPGIEIGDHTIDYEPEKMLAVAKDPAGRDWAEHAHCDLVVAAYSYPIVRVGCAGKTVNGAGCRWHDEPKWIERDPLRLLIAAYQAGDAVPEWVMEPYSSRCWSRERALRLGPLLGLESAANTPPVDEQTESRPGALRCSNCRKPVGFQPDGSVLAAYIHTDRNGVTCAMCQGVATPEQARRAMTQARYA